MPEVFSYGEDQIVLKNNRSPKKLYLEISSLCNFSCPMCFRNSRQGEFENRKNTIEDGSMYRRTIDNLMQQIPELEDLKEIVLGGIGEPLLHPELKEVIQFLSGEGLLVTIQTNGYLLSDELIDFIIEQKVHRLVVSYEPGEIGHKEDDKFYELIRNIAERKRYGRTNRPFVAVESVLTKETISYLKEMTTRCMNIGVDEFILTNLMPIAEEFTDKVLYFDDKPDVLKEFLQTARHRVHYQVPAFRLFTERSCRFAEQEAVVIRYDGECAPCYRFLHGGTEYVHNQPHEVLQYSFGNINYQPVKDIWNSRDYLWFRFTVANSLYPSCLDCQYKEGCDYLRNSESNCWGSTPSCGNCLWSRDIIMCP